MLGQWYTGKIIKIEQATTNTRRYWIEIPEVKNFIFKPGQFVTLDLPIHEQRNKRWRSYSIASWPDNTNIIELIIVFAEHGAGTHYLFEQIQEGSTLALRGPQGVFTLPATLDKDIFLICTGTGIAPFRSMLHNIKNKNTPHQNIYLIFGTRTQKNLLYADEMQALEKKIVNFKYIPTLSQEKWSGHTGYVHAIYESLLNKNIDAQFLLCGWKNMIDEARQRLQQLGYDKKQILFELYG